MFRPYPLVRLVLPLIAAPLAQTAAACKTGFVWREAFPGDSVYVTLETRTRTAADNRLEASRSVAAQTPPARPVTDLRAATDISIVRQLKQTARTPRPA
jgi:hypothetical protein